MTYGLDVITEVSLAVVSWKNNNLIKVRTHGRSSRCGQTIKVGKQPGSPKFWTHSTLLMPSTSTQPAWWPAWAVLALSSSTGTNSRDEQDVALLETSK